MYQVLTLILSTSPLRLALPPVLSVSRLKLSRDSNIFINCSIVWATLFLLFCKDGLFKESSRNPYMGVKLYIQMNQNNSKRTWLLSVFKGLKKSSFESLKMFGLINWEICLVFIKQKEMESEFYFKGSRNSQHQHSTVT